MNDHSPRDPMNSAPAIETQAAAAPANAPTNAPAAEPAAGPPPALYIRDLYHTFKNHQALAGVSFDVHHGCIHGFVGPNGAGKTTTLKIVCTLLKPQRGQVRVLGMDVVHRVKAVRQKIGFMPDHFSMYRQMSVYEYLDFFAAAYGLGAKDRTRVIGDVLALTDMEGRKLDLIRGLSRGMQQRVNLARVLINDPQLLLLDEPASGLDPRARIELMEILKELQRMGKTIFISSHILSELATLCDSVTIIDRGKIKYTGTMSDLLKEDGEVWSYTLLLASESPEVAAALKGLEGVQDVARDEVRKSQYRVVFDSRKVGGNAILQAAIAAGGTVLGFRQEEKHLNQAFMDLTEQGVRT